MTDLPPDRSCSRDVSGTIAGCVKHWRYISFLFIDYHRVIPVIYFGEGDILCKKQKRDAVFPGESMVSAAGRTQAGR